MNQALGDRPDAKRLRLLQSAFPSGLDEVAEAVAVATETQQKIYVERTGDGYRWSPTHSGGPYPLLRITARFLRVDYTRIVVPCRGAAPGVCVLIANPEDTAEPDRWAVIEFDGPTSADAVARRFVEALDADAATPRRTAPGEDRPPTKPSS